MCSPYWPFVDVAAKICEDVFFIKRLKQETKEETVNITTALVQFKLTDLWIYF